MAMTDTVILPNIVVQGDAVFNGSVFPGQSRTSLLQEANAKFVVPWTDFRVWDAFATNLPSSAGTDDLGLIDGTFATNPPSIQAGDVKTTSSTRRARFTFALPMNYDTGQSVTIRAHVGMKTTIADGSCTVDFEAYRSSDELTLGSDLVTTSATTMNSLTYADKDFVLSTATLVPGDILDIRLSVTYVDSASATAVIPVIGKVAVLVDVKG
jgi:hypothetical protein